MSVPAWSMTRSEKQRVTHNIASHLEVNARAGGSALSSDAGLVSWRALHARVSRRAAQLVQLGFVEGSLLAMAGPVTAPWLEIALAANLLGGTVALALDVACTLGCTRARFVYGAHDPGTHVLGAALPVDEARWPCAVELPLAPAFVRFTRTGGQVRRDVVHHGALLIEARREALRLAPHTTLRLAPVLDDGALGRLALWLVTGTRLSLAAG